MSMRLETQKLVRSGVASFLVAALMLGPQDPTEDSRKQHNQSSLVLILICPDRNDRLLPAMRIESNPATAASVSDGAGS